MTDIADADTRQLADLGYTAEFHRDMSLLANFSLRFTYLSPVGGVLGIYSAFAGDTVRSTVDASER